MKKALKVIGIILLIIVLAAGALVALNWKYVSALVNGLTMDQEELGQQRVENTQEALENVNSYMDVDIRPLTDEEKALIQSGQLSQTEVMAQIIAQATGIELPSDIVPEVDVPEGQTPEASQPEGQTPEASPQPEGQQPGATQQPSAQGGQQSSAGQQSTAGQQTAPEQVTKPQASSADQLVANCVSKLYGLQAQYTAQLDGLAASAKAYYHSQAAAVGSAAAKSDTLSKFSGQVSSMEGGCDAKVEAALSELSASLKAIGADTSIVGQLRSAYNKEKSNQRAAYVNRYLR